MNKIKQLRAMIEQMERDLGIWGNIMGALIIFGLVFAFLWVTP